MYPSQERLCVVCSTPLIKKAQKKYCSTLCYRKLQAQRYAEINGQRLDGIPAGTVGAIHEFMVAVDLLKKGAHVYRAMSPSTPGDLAVVIGGKLMLVEVTTGFRNQNNQLGYPSHAHRYDILAVVERSGLITYLPDILTDVKKGDPVTWDRLEK